MMNDQTKDAGTIDVYVNQQFKIKGTTAVHLKGKLSYQEDAFKLVYEERVENTKDKTIPIGTTQPTTYTLEALLPGEHKVEYQHLKPEWSNNPDGVEYSEVYKVVVKK